MYPQAYSIRDEWVANYAFKDTDKKWNILMWLFGLNCLMIQLCNRIKWQINVGDDDDDNK
jgi:hypothetical protein